MPAKALSPQQRADAHRLENRIKQWQTERKAAGEKDFSETYIGERTGLGGQSGINQYKKGNIPLNINALVRFSALFGCRPADISPTLASQIEEHAAAVAPDDNANDFAMIEHADVKFSAGRGSLVFVEGRQSRLAFRRDFLKAQGASEKSAVLVHVSGASMEPTIPDEAVLLVNRGARSVVNGRVFAFRLNGELLVKRMFNRGAELRAVSDNPDRESFPDIVLGNEEQEFEMIGRVLWMGAKL